MPKVQSARTKRYKRCVKKVARAGAARSPEDVCAAAVFHNPTARAITLNKVLDKTEWLLGELSYAIDRAEANKQWPKWSMLQEAFTVIDNTQKRLYELQKLYNEGYFKFD